VPTSAMAERYSSADEVTKGTMPIDVERRELTKSQATFKKIQGWRQSRSLPVASQKNQCIDA